MKRIKNILLIDDDYPTLYLHEIYIIESKIVDDIHKCMSVDEAIIFLKDSNQPRPDVIIFDINLPGKSGFDFLEEYMNLSIEQKESIKLFMCSTSESPRDLERLQEFPIVEAIIEKPLTTEKILEIAKSYF